MKVTYGWLKDFVEIKISPEELAQKLTMAGLEVTSLEKEGGDYVFEIEVTSNRPDWLSVIGVAREVAAITGAKLKKTKFHKITKSPVRDGGQYSIEIEDKKDCPLYTAKIIRDVKVGPSPAWLRNRLELVGCRSVNNIVDITNYVLFELGEPLHAFDADTIARDKIIVRRAKNQERILSIDGQERILNQDILIIADDQKPIAIAGVMGGKDTEVSHDSKNILLEAAIFNPVLVRRGRQKMGLQSEASYRFERGIDSEIVELASLRTVALIRELCGGDFVGVKRVGSATFQQRKIDLEAEAVERILGVKISFGRIKKVLLDLGFQVKAKAKVGFRVEIPSYRQDIKAPIDLIEEIARIFGFENAPTTLPAIKPQAKDHDTNKPLSLIKNILTGLGLNEVITYSLMDRKSLDGFDVDEKNLLEIANPLSQEQEVLRPQLMSSIAQRVAYNLRQQNPSVNIFEIAKVYYLEGGKTREKYSLAIGLCGRRSFWFGPQAGHVQDSPGFLHLKGIINVLLERIGIQATESKLRLVNSNEVDVLVKNEKVGLFRKLPRKILDELGIKYEEVFAAEIDLEGKLLPLAKMDKNFKSSAMPQFPGIVRDITLPVRREVSYEDISSAIYEAKEGLLTSVEFKDCYEGEKVPPGFKKMTLSLRYCSAERTLTDDEVAYSHAKIVKELEAKFQIKIS